MVSCSLIDVLVRSEIHLILCAYSPEHTCMLKQLNIASYRRGRVKVSKVSKAVFQKTERNPWGATDADVTSEVTVLSV